MIDSAIDEVREIFGAKMISTMRLSKKKPVLKKFQNKRPNKLLRKVVPYFFANIIECCIAVSISFFSCLFWNFFSASFFFDCLLDVSSTFEFIT